MKGKKYREENQRLVIEKKRSTNSKESIDADQETKQQNVENDKDEHGINYHFKPGKKSSNKRSSDQENSTNIKRKKGISESKENEKTEELINNTVEDVI